MCCLEMCVLQCWMLLVKMVEVYFTFSSDCVHYKQFNLVWCNRLLTINSIWQHTPDLQGINGTPTDRNIHIHEAGRQRRNSGQCDTLTSPVAFVRKNRPSKRVCICIWRRKNEAHWQNLCVNTVTSHLLLHSFIMYKM